MIDSVLRPLILVSGRLSWPRSSNGHQHGIKNAAEVDGSGFPI
jgi:hypothetical protein